MTSTPHPPPAPPAPAPNGRTFLGHPPGLFVLFFTEMWERFSYYGMRCLLVLYMVDFLFVRPDVGREVLGFNLIKGALESVFGPLANQPLSSQIYGLYTALVYATPFFGGMLADRVLGQRRAVVLGAVLMAIGEFILMVPGLFFVGLLVLILGNGAFKPNISTQVGSLYLPGDPRRDRAFTIFYMGVNLGATLSPYLCGTLGQKVGWRYGFGAAGVGMLLGLIIYLWGQKHLAADHLSRSRAAGPKVKEPLTRDEWKRIWALVVLCALNIIFWGCYEQQGNTMQLWADQNTDWTVFGWAIPSTWFQAFNPMMIFAFAPLVNLFWARQARRGREPDSVQKMSLGCFLLGSSYLIMILAAHGMTPETRRSFLWLAGTTLVTTIGELYLSPVGLSLVTKVAPARIVSMMMGVWYLSSFFGNYLSGFIGTFWEKIPHPAFFLMLCALGVTAGTAIHLASKPIRAALVRQP